MKRCLPFALALVAVLPLPALAHKSWLLPSATVLAPNDWIAVDAAVSESLFSFEASPVKLDTLVINAPDGRVLAPVNSSTGKFRSSFDLQLASAGTYRLAVHNNGLMASWQEAGQPKRWRGAADAFAREVPALAEQLKVTQTLARIETFVSAGKPSDTIFQQPAGTGLELTPLTHPNDLFSGETARFRLLLDGKPAVGLKVTLAPGGDRYRSQPVTLDKITDQDGIFSVSWPAPGMYWLGATFTDSHAAAPATERRLSYSATLEVLSQ